MLPNRDKLLGVFDDEVDVSFDSLPTSKPKKLNERKGKVKLGNFEKYGKSEWREYFRLKALEHGVRYIVADSIKESAILKSIMSKFTCWEIKDMIDFLWDAPHTLVKKETMGLYMLSSGWINTIYNASVLWKQGKYSEKKETVAQKREWTGKDTEEEGRIYI